MNIADAVKKCHGLVDKLAGLRENPLAETPVLFAKIKLLWKCNLACSFCNAYKRHGPGRIMRFDTAMDILKSLRGAGLKKVHFSGGEVFLHPDIQDILDGAGTMGLQVNLTSNGTLITRDIARFLSDKKIHSVSISLDSSKQALHDKLRRKKGAFKATMKGIENILRYRKKSPRLRINTVVTSGNFNDLDGIHELLAGLDSGIKWKLIPVDTTKKRLLLSEDQFLELYRRVQSWDLLEEAPQRPGIGSYRSMARGRYAAGYYRKHICYMPWIHLFIDPEGLAYTCCMARGAMEPMGRLSGNPLGLVLKGPGACSVRERMASGGVFDICHSCDDFIRENRDLERLIAENGKSRG